MPSRDELLAAGPRAYVIVGHRMQVPMASADGVRLENRWVEAGTLLPRADYDRFPARSKRSMTNTGYVQDPLSVKIEPLTGKPQAIPEPKPATVSLRPSRGMIEVTNPETGARRTVRDPGGLDRRQQTMTAAPPPKRKRGRPRKVRA